MAEIKACPFCGKIPLIVDCGDEWFIRCECGIEGKLFRQRCDAVKAWNRRK